MNKNNNSKVQIAVMATNVENIKNDVKDIKDKLQNDYVSQTEFKPIRNIVYGMVGLILTAVIIALVSLVILK